MPALVKKKLLSVASTGRYVDFLPAELEKYYVELGSFLDISGSSVDPDELLTLYEMQFYLALMTQHDVDAKTFLDRIIDQFGDKNSQRVLLLKSVYVEAQGDTKGAAELLGQDPDQTRLSRRLVTFSRKQGESESYITNLIYFLNIQPADLTTWGELGDEYAKIGHYDKAIHCYKEILLQEPYAYNMFYKVGLMYYYRFVQESKVKMEKKDRIMQVWAILAEARNNLLRCIELCGTHPKAWAAIAHITDREFNKFLDKFPTPQTKAYLAENLKLHKAATSRAPEPKA